MTSVIAPEDGPKQGENRFDTVSEQEKATRILREAVQRWLAERSRNRATQLLCVLLELAQAEQGATEGAINIELYEALQKRWPSQWSDDDDPGSIRGKIRKTWRQAEEVWESRRRGIEERLLEQGIALRPKIGKTGGGGRGNSNRYWLRWEAAQSDRNTVPQPTEPVPENGLRYFTEELDEPGHLRWLARGVSLSGWGGRLFVGGLVFASLGLLGLTAILALGVVLSPGSPGTLMVFLLYLFVAWWVIRPLVRLGEDRQIVAPWWLQSLDGPDDRLLELQADSTGQGNRLRLTRYVGACPRCGAEIHLGKGPGALHDRIVGRCRRVPTEHVYSFDPALRIGNPLR